ncbi:MAG: DM13 domain-containing protein [Thiolinea sp.]
MAGIQKGDIEMSIGKITTLLATHGIALAVGFAAGIYALPILIAPDSPSTEAVSAVAASSQYSAEFRRDLKDSDAFHWGEGEVFIGPESISHMGKLAPGPDYKLYLSPEFVETEADFNRLKPDMALVGDVKTFDSFLVSVPPGINPADYNSVIVWCETFGEFITAAKYR